MSVLLINNSGSIISCYVADGLNSGFSYPETTLPQTINAFCLKENIKDSSYIYGRRASDYNDLLSTTQKGVLSVYIFDQKDVEEVGWDQIFELNQYIIRYDFTAKDLQDLRGIIYYPPSASMKSIHMDPLYEEVIAKYGQSAE